MGIRQVFTGLATGIGLSVLASFIPNIAGAQDIKKEPLVLKDLKVTLELPGGALEAVPLIIMKEDNSYVKLPENTDFSLSPDADERNAQVIRLATLVKDGIKHGGLLRGISRNEQLYIRIEAANPTNSKLPIFGKLMSAYDLQNWDGIYSLGGIVDNIIERTHNLHARSCDPVKDTEGEAIVNFAIAERGVTPTCKM